MRDSLPLQWSSVFAVAIVFCQLAAGATGSTTPTPLEALDQALLHDILEAYTTHQPSICNSSVTGPATSFSFNWPDTNPDSNWYDTFIPFEEKTFQAIMSHTDDTPGDIDRSWSIRVGTGGNIYSHYAPGLHGETMPPQKHAYSPWIDEVQQSVAVNTVLNKNDDFSQYCPVYSDTDKSTCKPYFIHQAGAYQEDAPYTDVPFISPSLARHCEGNSCAFASWGTSAHVATPFTSPIMYVNKYTNCGDGIIEHTQMIHNFADPSNPASTTTNVDQTYFNVGWGGVRSSSLPYALEPDPTAGTLSYDDVNDVDYLPICKWGSDGASAGRGQRKELNQLGGYTSFVADGLLVNQTSTPIQTWCRKDTDPTCADVNTCMVATCTDADIANGYTRIELKVPANSSPNCIKHVVWNGLISLQCNMRDLGFGKSFPFLSSSEPCAPWTNIGFYNSITGEGVDVAFVRHWSFSPNNRRVYFAVYETDEQAAKDLVNGIFNNVGNSNPLPIEIRPTSNVPEVPAGYDPSSLPAFTYVYGKGPQYGDGVDGRSRRRLGSTEQGTHARDYTVFTINWYGSSRLEAGSTYTNRAYMIASDLGSVETTAGALVSETFADEMGPELYSPRTVNIYRSGAANFVVVAAAAAQGTSTSCASSGASLVCSGTSTPKSGNVPFFYVTCGTSTYLGPDPYHFTPSFGGSFPGHGTITNPVRSYLCDGQDTSIRPTWKMMGFFDASNVGCASLVATTDMTHDDTVCDAVASSSPSKNPTSSPSKMPTSQPSKSPISTSSPSQGPTKTPSNSPTDAPSSSPSKMPTRQPSKSPRSTPSPSQGPTTQPTSSPSNSPSKNPTEAEITAKPTKATAAPSKSPTSPPTGSPSTSPSLKPTPEQGECLLGDFTLEFDGACTAASVLDAYTDQVYNAPGATASFCSISAADDLGAKLAAAGFSDASTLCDQVYLTQANVPFTSAASRGTDLHFEKMFYNGRTDWQEEIETIYETDDYSRSSYLKEDAEAVRAFYDGVAQGHRVEWPGTLPNFKSSLNDADGLATCTTNAAMCCWAKDRQANDNNGNCAKPYDENCVDNDPADNTDLCFVDLERGNTSTEFDSTDTIVFPGDNNQGEGSIHCHGLAWSNNINDHTARYKANNLFFVSMYDHMYQRGYVKNVPGAPMCGCVEQMPTVSRSDCTQVDLTETITITYDAENTIFNSKLTAVHVDFNACRGINNRNNDLWAYIAKLYYQKDITREQFGEAGRIITNTNCFEATNHELNKHSLTPGYDHDVDEWTRVAGRESMYLLDPHGHMAFTRSLVPNIDDPTNAHYGIIYRACQSCFPAHMKIFYRRKTPVPDELNLQYQVLYSGSKHANNTWNVDFSLHSTYEDALNNVNPWKCPNNSFNYHYTFYGRCSPDGIRVDNQRSRFHVGSDRHDVAYFVNKPEDDGLRIEPTNIIKGREYASGMALKDPTDGTIYMTGAGRDIAWYRDDFNYLSEEVDGDHTAVVHVGSISSPQPHGWSKSGILFRSSLETNAAYYGLYLTGSNGVCFQGRMYVGSYYSHFGCVQAGIKEAWIKIEKQLDMFYSFIGAQETEGGPITWTQIHSRTIAVIGEGSYQVGLGISSGRSFAQEVLFTGYEVDATL